MALFKKGKKKEKPEKKEKTGKKGGIKKLLIPLLGLVLVAAAAFAVVRFVLPSLGSGEKKEKPTDLEAYTIGEDSAVSIDTVFEEVEGEKEGRLLANRGPEWFGKDPEEIEERRTYIYEMENCAAVVNRYLDVMLASEQGFSLVDETFLRLEERPELQDVEGALILARPSVVEGHVFQLVIGWSQSNSTLAVRASAPEGALHSPEKRDEPEPTSVREQLDDLEQMAPAQLTLPGNSMSDYDIYPVEGFVTIDGNLCRRFNFYEKGKPGDIAGIIFYSGDNQHLYRMDVEDNTIITELK